MEDNDVYNYLFTESDTYCLIPQLLEQAIEEVSVSKYDKIKEIAINHHISGMIEILQSALNCLNKLEKQAIILGINLEYTMDEEVYKDFLKIKNIRRN